MECKSEPGRHAPSHHAVIILAAGQGLGWSEHMGIPKQLIPVGASTILDRTVALVRAQGHEPVIVTRDARLHRVGADHFEPSSCEWTTRTLQSTRQLWSTRTTVLLGDVIYQPETLRRAMNETADIAFYGRTRPNLVTGKLYPERFALSFHKEAWADMERAIERVNESFTGYLGAEGKLSTLERELGHQAELRRRCGYTEDIDTPLDMRLHYPNILRAMMWPRGAIWLVAVLNFLRPAMLWYWARSVFGRLRRRGNAIYVSEHAANREHQF